MKIASITGSIAGIELLRIVPWMVCIVGFLHVVHFDEMLYDYGCSWSNLIECFIGVVCVRVVIDVTAAS